MNRFVRVGLASAIVVAATIGGLSLLPSPASATWGVPVKDSADCPNASGWYVNPDEAALAPRQKEQGFLFDGPSIVHRELAGSGLDLADVRAGSFTASLKAGVLPLFKMETYNPYTTINVTPGGKFWATAMNPGDTGGMDHPVATVAELIGKPTKPGKPQLTSATKVVTFGVGYANDTGNTALVKTITFHGTTYQLTCVLAAIPSHPGVRPTPSSSASASPSASASARPSSSASKSTTPVAVTGQGGGPSLPVTGAPVQVLGAIGALIVGAGGVLLFTLRRRKVKFTA